MKKITISIILAAVMVFFGSVGTFAVTNEEFCQAARNYYVSHTWDEYVPPYANCVDNGDVTYTIQLYDYVDEGNGLSHMTTAAWYRVDRNGKGHNTVTSEYVQLDLSSSESMKTSDYCRGYDDVQGTPKSFYGVWCAASKSYAEILQKQDELTACGFPSKVYYTAQWSNLNSEGWYALSAGPYASQEYAQDRLLVIQKYYPDAYVRYSGEYIG